jgi:hypothetical protein
MRKLVLIFGPIEVSIPILLALAATLKAGPGGDLAFIVGENRRPLTEGASATYSARPTAGVGLRTGCAARSRASRSPAQLRPVLRRNAAVGPSVVAIHWTRSARGDIYLIAFFRTVSSITLPFASSIQAL